MGTNRASGQTTFSRNTAYCSEGSSGPAEKQGKTGHLPAGEGNSGSGMTDVRRERERESVEEVSALGSKYMWTNG